MPEHAGDVAVDHGHRPRSELEFWRLCELGQRPDVGDFVARARICDPRELTAVLRMDQCDRWPRGERVLAEDYLEDFPSVRADVDSTFELIYSEFLLREEQGDMPSCDEYVGRFPEHGTRLRLQIQLHLAIDELGDARRETEYGSDTDADTIGPYKLLQQIGEGGMGTVYLAEQTHPVHRTVALKVIKAGMDSRQVIARFEAERQALAIMDHVNIARVLDAGTTGGSRRSRVQGRESSANSAASPALDPRPSALDLSANSAASPALDPRPSALDHSTGRPYFVMELVHGVPITKYCDDNRLTLRERLELFVPVCQAIQHAHQKGIIHRDIKPSNVMITLCDGKAIPKVIDFGVAKATEQKLTELTLFTQYGSMVGTLEYMSPEQADMSAQGVDTRSDIYSLGVLLYELLTGTTPLTHQRMLEAGHAEILRMIKDEEPPKPSTRLSNAGEALALISANRHTEPAKLMRLMRGELDWIALKAMEKDRNRRYESVSTLAADVQRYLHDEPVQACPPTFWYRFRKLAGRNKRAFVTASAAALAVVLALVGLAVSNVLIRQEQVRTQEAKNRAEMAQQVAQSRAEEIQRGLEGLKAANAWLDRGRWYLTEGEWDDAHTAFKKAVELRPDHVSVWVERADLYTRLGLWDLAAADYAREMDLREADTSKRWYQHALLRYYVGDVDGYRQACRRMNKRFRGTTRASFFEEVLCSNVLAPGSDADLSRLAELSEDFVAHSRPSDSLYILGTAHYRAGQFEQSIQRLREVLASDWPSRGLAYPVLAMAHHRQGQAAEARKALDEAARVLDQWTWERYQDKGGDWLMRFGADTLWPLSWWHYLEYQLYYREAKLLIDGWPPPDDPRLHVLRARSLAKLRWNRKADIEYAAALNLRPEDSQVRVEAHCSAGYSATSSQQWRRAADEFTKASELAPDDVTLWRFRAVTLLGADDVHAYRQTCLAMLDRFEQTTDIRVAGNVVLVCVLRDDALPDMGRLLPLATVASPWGHAGAYAFGETLYRAGRYEEAVKCLDEAAQSFFRPDAAEWCFLAMTHHRLGHTDKARFYLAEAARWIDEANRQTEADLSRTRPSWGGWHGQVWCPLLFREAETLLKTEPRVEDN